MFVNISLVIYEIICIQYALYEKIKKKQLNTDYTVSSCSHVDICSVCWKIAQWNCSKISVNINPVCMIKNNYFKQIMQHGTHERYIARVPYIMIVLWKNFRLNVDWYFFSINRTEKKKRHKSIRLFFIDGKKKYESHIFYRMFTPYRKFRTLRPLSHTWKGHRISRTFF